MPARNADPGSLLYIERAEIYRLAEPLSAAPRITEDEFASRSVVIGSQRFEENDFGLKTMTYRDTLQFAGQPVRLRYAIRFVNASGQRAAFSNVVVLEPAPSIASAPTSLSYEVSQEEIRLTWSAPTENVDGSQPLNLIGYNIYRSESEAVAGRLLNRDPITDQEYSDQFFEFGKKYFYFVRAVSTGAEGRAVESTESNLIEVSPVDTFPPSPPSSITIAASPTSISIFFPANPEKDIAGYSIYRSEDRDTPIEEWQLLMPDLTPKTTFVDENVVSGRTYFYYITATDTFKNVSKPSEIVSETVP
ncbi:fibronectin type III domain-containing protein [Leptolyngbya sp. 7M]|uniref:fibronectin type III domain-containing protein n=1 Tax=Leptolyngbya sp. 7M TaxID=2812896 RepID=UPI001B8B79C8|nr:hypothetical protein [Leptolyngbya sp. 7M]QYO65608.1 hypothetical protein JVX88_02125 [Leptolyngbya sp. 7M]